MAVRGNGGDAESSGAAPGPHLDPLHILLVDAIKANRDFLAGVIQGPGREIVGVASGGEALEYVAQEPDCALVLLDVQIQGPGAFATARALRANAATAEVPLMFITAAGGEEQAVVAAYDAGAVDFLFRPVDAHILRSKVEVFCRLHLQKRAIQAHLEHISEQHAALQQQLEEIRVLRGLIPICANCKSVRNDTGFWEAIESYIQAHSEAEFSHSVCPDCAKALYPELHRSNGDG
jgi:CheY-like chemotaxis protein